MKQRASVRRLPHWNIGPVVLVFVGLSSGLAAQTTSVIDVNEPRPLIGALDALERIVRMPINYEDPPYESEADLQDVSTPEQRAAVPGYRLLVPRRGRVTAQFQINASVKPQESDVVSYVNLLLSDYRQKGLPGDFQVELANGMLYVTPAKVTGANGVLRDTISPMMTRVTLPYAQRTVAETVHAIFDAVRKATGREIAIGAFPFWPTDTIAFGASGESARDALARLFAQAGKGQLSYRLTFDPLPDRMRSFDYMINVQRTAHVSAAAPPSVRPTVPKPTTSSQPVGGGPGMVRANP